MLKIALHCDVQSRKQFEPALSKYLTEKNMPFEIYHVNSASKFLSNYFFQSDFQLLLICKNDTLSYIMKTYHNFDKNYMHMVSGVLELPLKPESIEKELFDNIENSYCCPFGVYVINNRTFFQSILHEDIEYIQREKNKTIIYLRNGETVETNKSINTIKKELNEKYFVKCSKGYLVNTFNIKKAYKDIHSIELKSGARIPLTKRNFKEFLRTYIFSMHGFRIWDN